MRLSRVQRQAAKRKHMGPAHLGVGDGVGDREAVVSKEGDGESLGPIRNVPTLYADVDVHSSWWLPKWVTENCWSTASPKYTVTVVVVGCRME